MFSSSHILLMLLRENMAKADSVTKLNMSIYYIQTFKVASSFRSYCCINNNFRLPGDFLARHWTGSNIDLLSF